MVNGTEGIRAASSRVLFVMHHSSLARLFEAAIRELADRGCHVHLAFSMPDDEQARLAPESGSARSARRGDDLVRRLCTDHANVTAGPAAVRSDRWVALADGLRRGHDYLRYLSPTYARSPKLRARARRQAPGVVVRLSARVRSPFGLAVLDRLLRWLERSIPDSAAVTEFLRSRGPDLLVVTPLVGYPAQADYLRSAKALGLRTALCVASWDNLTNKGLIRDVPDCVYVWNQDQVREAVELHGIPPERMVATGAHSFDQWFTRRPSTSPEEFRQRLDLPPGRPIVLYLCSSKFVAPDEPRFVERWLRQLRDHSDDRLREAGILIRPHPKSGVQWADERLSHEVGVAVWPRLGESTASDGAKADFFDSMWHCSAVVGLNTSALIESTIVGRPAFTVLTSEFEETQEGTLHFRYLVRENGGPLTVTRSFDEHFEQLALALRPDGSFHDDGGFIRRFVRPTGLDRTATAILVDALAEQVENAPPQPRPRSRWRTAISLALVPLAWWTSRTTGGARAQSGRSRRRKQAARRAQWIRRKSVRRWGRARRTAEAFRRGLAGRATSRADGEPPIAASGPPLKRATRVSSDR